MAQTKWLSLLGGIPWKLKPPLAILAAPRLSIATIWLCSEISFNNPPNPVFMSIAAIANRKLDEQLLEAELLALGSKARAAARTLALAPAVQKNAALLAAAKALRGHAAHILAQNQKDVAAARDQGRPDSFVDRLKLTDARIESMARGLEEIAELPDPVGRVSACWKRPNGLEISRVQVPLGVIGIIYESRPNVTSDAGGLCLKSGNAVILRGGSECVESNRAIHACLKEGLLAAELPDTAIQLIGTPDR